jgi:apolipoprotein N-acyltransferase
MTGATPYVRFGDLPVLALAFVLAIGGAAAAARRQNRAG